MHRSETTHRTFSLRPRHLGWLACCLAILLTKSPNWADDKDKPDPGELTLDRIYNSSDFSSKSFAGRWLDGEAAYVLLKKSADGRDIVRVDAVSGDDEVLVPAADTMPAGTDKQLAIEGYKFSKSRSHVLIYTNSQRVWRQKTRGDYWVLDRSSRELTQLGGDGPPATMMFAKFSPSGTHVAYVRHRNIYVQDLRGGGIRQVTKTKSPHVINGTFDWVYEEELGLRDGFRWSPDGKRIAFWQLDTTGVRTFPLVNHTDGLYPRIKEFAYPKVGQRNSSSRIGVVEVASGKTTWIKLPGDPRNRYIARMDWAENSDELLVQQLNRLQNVNRVMLADVRSGKARTILTERDNAWVDVHDELQWMRDRHSFTWISERDGWRHLYLASRGDGKVQQVTRGEFDVSRLLKIDEASDVAYFIASPGDATRRYLYRCRLDGSGLQRVTPADQPGSHSYLISTDGRLAFHTYTTADQPPTTELVTLPTHETVRVLEENRKLAKAISKLRRVPREFFQVEIEAGVRLDAWCIKPPTIEAGKRYPLLVYVYGEPAGSTVVDRWGGSSYLWHAMLAQQGYFVMSIDNRGTNAPRGRAWRKSIYRQVGVLAPRDQAAAVRTILKQRSELDASRVGIWGWSGGGSMSLNAIFKFPDLYHTAIAIAPVPNQRHYDTIYQERYMGLPDDNVDGFRDGSPINFASQLRGNLLLIHGTADDNVHYQGTEALANELIRHNKPFTMMAYPNRTHSIREGKNTTRHLRELMTRYLHQHLPAGPR